MSEENKPTPQSEADKEKELAAKRNAFLRYMTIIFAVAFLLVLISLVLQAHTAKAALSDLKESNSSALSNAAVNAELKRRGFTDDDLARITTPLGLPILAETPAEIAISIAAQLIQVRAQS